LIIAAFVLDISAVERAIVLAVCFISLLVELLNSAIEAVVDRISLEQHPLSKNAKDMGSAAPDHRTVDGGRGVGVILLG
jgi:diacylglycerol kinase (ATP)